MGRTGMIRHMFYGAGLFMLAAPVFLLAGCRAGIGALALLPLAAAVLISLMIPRLGPRLRLPCIVLGAAACAFLSFRLGSGVREDAWRWICAALAVTAAFLYPKYTGLVIRDGVTPGVWYGGLAVYAACWLIHALTPALAAGDQLALLTWVYFIYLIFAQNVSSLYEGVGRGRAPSRAMLLRNAAVSALWAGAFLLLTHLPQVMAAFRAALEAVRDAVLWFISLFNRAAPMEPSQGGSGGADFGALAGEGTGPSWLMQLLEKALYVIAAVLVLAAAVLLLRLILRAARRALSALRARWRAYMDAVNDSYQDQVESLLDWGEVRRALSERRHQRRAARGARVPWDSLSPRQQVRRSYQNYLARHPEAGAQQTARQTLPDPRQADIYEAARYSSREITPEEAREMRDRTH